MYTPEQIVSMWQSTPEFDPTPNRTKFQGALYGKPLSACEIQVLEQVSLGLSTQEIGLLLFITRDTVKTHLARIRLKAGPGLSMAGLVGWGFRNKVLT